MTKTWTSAIAIALLALTSASQASASGGLSSTELERLGRGETIVRSQDLEQNDHSYIGGVTYAIVDATAPEIMTVLEDVRSYKHLLPRTKSAQLVGENDGDAFVELRQGTALVETTYTIRVHRTEREMRFWLDRSKPHGIEDAWGFFRVEPLPVGPHGARTLVTFGVLADIGPGIVKELFSERIRGMMFSVPDLVRRYFALNPPKARKA